MQAHQLSSAERLKRALRLDELVVDGTVIDQATVQRDGCGLVGAYAHAAG